MISQTPRAAGPPAERSPTDLGSIEFGTFLFRRTTSALVLLLTGAPSFGAWTPSGAPAGLSVGPDSLTLREERTEFVFHDASDSLSYVLRIRVRNDGSPERFAFAMPFAGGEGWGDPRPPSLQITCDGRILEDSLTVVCDAMTRRPSRYEFSFPLELPSGREAALELSAGLRLEPFDCTSPAYQFAWTSIDERSIGVAGADREAVFRFDPPRSPVEVDADPPGCVLDEEGFRWRWRGGTRSPFEIRFEASGDEHLEWFPVPYELSDSYRWDRHRLDLWEPCSIEAIEFAAEPGAPDTIDAEIHEWIDGRRGEAEAMVEEIVHRHMVDSPGDLNPIEQGNLEMARETLQALDPAKHPSEILNALQKLGLY